MQLYTSVVALLFQFISLSAELTGIGELLVLLSPQTPKLYGIIGVAFVTTLYTVLGGLKASMSTDKWQGIGVIALVALVCTAMLTQVNFHALQWKQSNVVAFTDHGFQSLITLCVAVTSANLFLTGFWQRVRRRRRRHELSFVLYCIVLHRNGVRSTLHRIAEVCAR